MTIIEVLVNLFIGILANSITVIADRYDSSASAKFEKLKKELKTSNLFEKAIAGSLKSINVNSREIDELKIIINEDFFIKKLADIVIRPSQETEIIKLLVDRIKEGCNLSKEQALTLNPFIDEFAFTLYGKVLSDSELSPHLIIKEIEISSIKSQQEHCEIKEEVAKVREDLKKGFDELKQKLSLEDESTQSINEKLDKPLHTFTPSRELNIAPSSRANNFIEKELNDALEKLNEFFKSEVDQIRQIQKKRDFAKAIELYESLLEKADTKIDETTIFGIYIDCALCSINIGNSKAADNWLSKAENMDIDDERVFAVRGLYYYELGDKDKGNEYADNAWAINNSYHLALIIKTAYDLGKGSTGKEVLDRYFLDGSGNMRQDFKEIHLAVIFRTMGQCYVRDKEYDKAIEHFERSLKIDSLDDSTQALIGTAYMEKGLGKEAGPINYYKKLTPDNERLIEKAIEHFSEALKLAVHLNKIKHHISTYTNRSSCYMILGDYDKAYDSSNISSTAEDILKSRAAAAYHKGLYTEAEELLSKIENATALDISNRVISLLNANDINGALKLIEDALNNTTFNEKELAEIRYLKFEILLSTKDKEDAEKELTQIIQLPLPEWQKEKAQGDYCELINDYKNADIHFKKAWKGTVSQTV